MFKACQPFNLAVILYKSQFKQFLLNILADIIWRSLFIWKLLVIKNETHVKKVGHTSEFLFNIYWWTFLKKTTIYLKNCWIGPMKNMRISIFTVYQKPKWKIKWKKCVEISSFYTCVQNIIVRWSNDVQFVRYGARRTDGRTDRQKKWHIEVSDSLKKCYKLTESWK